MRHKDPSSTTAIRCVYKDVYNFTNTRPDSPDLPIKSWRSLNKIYQSIVYIADLVASAPLPNLLSLWRLPKCVLKIEPDVSPTSDLQRGHSALILSHLSTHTVWKKWEQGSSRSSSLSAYFARQIQQTCSSTHRTNYDLMIACNITPSQETKPKVNIWQVSIP